MFTYSIWSCLLWSPRDMRIYFLHDGAERSAFILRTYIRIPGTSGWYARFLLDEVIQSPSYNATLLNTRYQVLIMDGSPPSHSQLTWLKLIEAGVLFYFMFIFMHTSTRYDPVHGAVQVPHTACAKMSEARGSASDLPVASWEALFFCLFVFFKLLLPGGHTTKKKRRLKRWNEISGRFFFRIFFVFFVFQRCCFTWF